MILIIRDTKTQKELLKTVDKTEFKEWMETHIHVRVDLISREKLFEELDNNLQDELLTSGHILQPKRSDEDYIKDSNSRNEKYTTEVLNNSSLNSYFVAKKTLIFMADQGLLEGAIIDDKDEYDEETRFQKIVRKHPNVKLNSYIIEWHKYTEEKKENLFRVKHKGKIISEFVKLEDAYNLKLSYDDFEDYKIVYAKSDGAVGIVPSIERRLLLMKLGEFAIKSFNNEEEYTVKTEGIENKIIDKVNLLNLEISKQRKEWDEIMENKNNGNYNK